jgi:hypothetical protein
MVGSPMPRDWASAVIARRAASESIPSKRPELTSTPSFDTASVIASTRGTAPSRGFTTTVMGRPYFRANS